MAEAGTWDEAMLMGVGEEGKGAEAVKSDPMLWGVPGYLTKEEADAFVSFDQFMSKTEICILDCNSTTFVCNLNLS